MTDIIAKINLTGKIVADIACGFGRWGHVIRALTDQGGHMAQIIGCDIYAPYLRTVKKQYNPYSDLILCDVRCLPFKDKAIDMTLACDILEHLKKCEGYKFITEIERIYTIKHVMPRFAEFLIATKDVTANPHSQ